MTSVLQTLVAFSICWLTSSSLSIYPHSLSYFNEAIGGPLNGPKHLLGSNVDWGQDLLYLQRWLRSHPSARPIKLAYYGYYNPREAEIEVAAPSESSFGAVGPNIEKRGWYAVSVNLSCGLHWFYYDESGDVKLFDDNALTRFHRQQPIDRAGMSLNIYCVE